MLIRFILSLCLVYAFYLNGTAQVIDDFSDGDFINNPAWNGDNSKFEINADKQLHLNAPAVTDTAYISTPNSLIDNIEWKFFFKMDFAPSSSNFLKVYLIADQENLKKPINGYFLKMGTDGSNDAIELYRQQGTTATLLLKGIDGHVAASTNSVSVKVTRDAAGNWEVFSDITGGTDYTLEGGATDNTFTNSAYFGFFCKYTSTRSTLFYFDDVYIDVPFVDVIPPQLISVKTISANQLDVTFNEPLETTSAQTTANYLVNNGIGAASIATQDVLNKALIHLTFPNSFESGVVNTLSVSNLADLSGNVMIPSSEDFMFFQSNQNDIIINEIMADPTPVVGLPEAEFVELYNTSAFPVDLGGWKFSDATSTQTLSAFVLQPDSYVILCDDANAALFQGYGNVLFLSSFPAMNNEGDQLSLMDATGNEIDAVSYELSWYQNTVKSQGGFTLEKIEPSGACSGPGNWRASDDISGGTPGKKNSVTGNYIDSIPPRLLHASVIDQNTIQLVFTESLDNSTAFNNSLFSIEPELTVNNVGPAGTDFSIINFNVNPSMDTNVVYTVYVRQVSDCHGNVLLVTDTVQVAIPSSIGIGDILINEILFNPASGGYDFVELYNNTSKFFDLKDLRISNANDDDSLSNIKNISNESRLFYPDSYMVLTENDDWVKLNYYCMHPDAVLKITDLPSYNDDEGKCVIVNLKNQRVDQLNYSDDWHFPLIDDDEGVSLERISPNRPAQDSMNWHSAASSVGYGTPTYRNSQYSIPDQGNEITLSPQVFSPDQDGFNDILNISYLFDQAGYMANIKIYDAEGRLSVNLIQNALLAQSGTFTWNGITNRGEKARMGTYIVFTEIFDLSGNVKHHKKVCVVAAKR